jgi:hypothetical protein
MQEKKGVERAIEGAVKVRLPFEDRRGAETLPRTEIMGAGGSAVAVCASETGGNDRRLRRVPTSGPGRSAAAERRRERQWLLARYGPAQQGRRKENARTGRLGGDGSRSAGLIGPEGGRERKRSFSFFLFDFPIHFPKFLKFF